MNANKSFDGEFRGLKLFPEENIMDIQRQHKIALIIPLSGIIFSIILVIVMLISLIYYSGNLGGSILFIPALTASSVALSFLSALSGYIFMHWFYMFYIITNKRLIHVHFFRIGGFHLDEVFHERTDPLEIDRKPRNFFLDFLGIEDIYVYFQRFERPEPFIFETPEDSNRIEELLEEHILKRRDRQ